jgi:hypothetical protein
LTFSTSDESFQLKLQKKWVFQQAANCLVLICQATGSR